MSIPRHAIMPVALAAGLGVLISSSFEAAAARIKHKRTSSQIAAIETVAAVEAPRREASAELESPGTSIETRKLQSVLGMEVRTTSAENMGRIVDLLADLGGAVQAAVIEFGGFLGIGTRKIAVEWSALRFEADGKQSVAVLDKTRDQLRVAPEYKPGDQMVVVRADR